MATKLCSLPLFLFKTHADIKLKKIRSVQKRFAQCLSHGTSTIVEEVHQILWLVQHQYVTETIPVHSNQ